MKRITREKDARDLALGVVEAQIQQLEKLRELAMTDEMLGIANAIFKAMASDHCATPSLGDKCFQFNVYMTGLNRWTDPKLTDLLDDLRALGPNDQSIKEFRDSHNNDYHFCWRFQDDYCVLVTVMAYENAATSECRRVQVGVKMVEQPVYRYDCVVPEGNGGELPKPILALEDML